MMNELNYALAYAKQEREIRVVVIDAEGDIFCAGADLRGLLKKSLMSQKLRGQMISVFPEETSQTRNLQNSRLRPGRSIVDFNQCNSCYSC